MLRDKSILENFNLVEELDDESAASYSGGLSGTWQLKIIGAKPVVSQSPITASFENGQVSGQAFCNRYFASYETKGQLGRVGELEVGLIGTTAIGCQDSLTKQDLEYFNALKTASSYTINSNLLILSGGEEILVYEALV